MVRLRAPRDYFPIFLVLAIRFVWLSHFDKTKFEQRLYELCYVSRMVTITYMFKNLPRTPWDRAELDDILLSTIKSLI